MARTIEEGLDYFPLDVDFYDDPKIIYIEEVYGIKGGYTANRLLCWIYRHGYYIKWDECMALAFAKRVGNGVTHSLVTDIVNVLLKRGFFDQEKFERYAILTSHGIQRRWLEIIRRTKRKAKINSLFAVINSVIDTPIDELMQAIEEGIEQRKEKKKKENVVEDTQPKFGDTTLKDIDAIRDDCLKDRVYFVEHVCRQLKITPESVPKHLSDFNDHLRSTAVTVKYVADYRNHFQNWMRKRGEKQETQTFYRKADASKYQ